MKTKKPKDGEFIPLRFDGLPDALYVHGHVTDEVATAALSAEHDNRYTVGPWVHKYARWSMEATWDGPDMVIRDHSEPGRGRFKVTVCDVLSRRAASESRWHVLAETSPSGKTQFRCESCGVVSVTPDRVCGGTECGGEVTP